LFRSDFPTEICSNFSSDLSFIHFWSTQFTWLFLNLLSAWYSRSNAAFFTVSCRLNDLGTINFVLICAFSMLHALGMYRVGSTKCVDPFVCWETSRKISKTKIFDIITYSLQTPILLIMRFFRQLNEEEWFFFFSSGVYPFIFIFVLLFLFLIFVFLILKHLQKIFRVATELDWKRDAFHF